MSDLEEDAGLGRQRSIFSGMGRVRHIHQFREKWSAARPKTHKKYSVTLQGEERRDKGFVDAQVGARPRLHRALTASDLERYRSIALWLSSSGIDIPDAPQAQAETAARAGGADVFDDVLDSLDALEKSVEDELAFISKGIANENITSSGTDPTAAQMEPPICDYVVVVGPDMADVAARNFWNRQENVFEATVAFAYPPQCQFSAESIEHFCFPRGIDAVVDSDGGAAADCPGEFFVLLLSGGGAQGQSVQYAFCMKGLARVPSSFDGGRSSLVPVCYCLVSQLPLVSFFRDMLRQLLDDMQREATATNLAPQCSVVSNEHSHYVDSVFRKLRAVRVLEREAAVAIDIFLPPGQPLVLQRPGVDDGKDSLLLQWALPLLLSSLTIDQVLRTLALLLIEMKVIVVCDQLSLVTSTTLGLASMLQPLSWAGPLITVLPPFLHEYMEAPVPLICGVDALPPTFESTGGTGIVHVLDHHIVVHPDDALSLEALKIPGADALCRDLEFFTSQIRQPKSERIVAFGVDVVIRRVRLHIQQLLDACTRLEVPVEASVGPSEEYSADELKFMRSVMQTQMYQKYRDDNPLAARAAGVDLKTAGEAAKPDDRAVAEATASTELETSRSAFKSAVNVIFRIALTGVNEVDGGGPESNWDVEEASDYGAYFQPHSGSDSEGEGNADDTDARQLGGEVSDPRQQQTRVEASGDPVPRHSDSDSSQPRLSPRDASSSVSADTIGSNSSSPEQVDSEITLADIEAEINLCRADLDFHPLRREDTETTMSLLGTTFSELMLRGGGSHSDADWLSESSEDDNFHDCHDRDEAEAAPTNASARAQASNNSGSSLQTAASCVKIQRTWRDWIARRRRPGRQPTPIAEPQLGGTLLYDDARSDLLHHRMEILHELEVLTRGVAARKEDAARDAGEGRLCVSGDLSRLEWRPTVELPSVSSVKLLLIQRISSRVSARSGDPTSSTAGWLVTDIHFDGGTWRFRHDSLAQDFFCFLRWITTSILNPSGGGTSSSASSSLTDSSRSLPTSVSSTSESAANSVSAPPRPPQDLDGLDRFKAALRAGFLIEKHGRSGKPHAKTLCTDTTCSQLVWKKPAASRASDPHAKSASFFQKSLPIASIKAVLHGKQTIVFSRSTARTADENLCLSIVGTTRTLDIRAYTKEDYELLVCGFTLLVRVNAMPRL